MDESKNEKMTSLAGASSEEIARAIAEVMDDMKAHDIKILRVSAVIITFSSSIVNFIHLPLSVLIMCSRKI